MTRSTSSSSINVSSTRRTTPSSRSSGAAPGQIAVTEADSGLDSGKFPGQRGCRIQPGQSNTHASRFEPVGRFRTDSTRLTSRPQALEPHPHGDHRGDVGPPGESHRCRRLGPTRRTAHSRSDRPVSGSGPRRSTRFAPGRFGGGLGRPPFEETRPTKHCGVRPRLRLGLRPRLWLRRRRREAASGRLWLLPKPEGAATWVGGRCDAVNRDGASSRVARASQRHGCRPRRRFRTWMLESSIPTPHLFARSPKQ